MTDPVVDLVARYVASWNERDAKVRNGLLAELWAPEAAPNAEYAACPARDGFVLRPTSDITGRRNTVRFTWDLVPATGGAPVSRGFDFVVLDDDGRVANAHRFAQPPPPSGRLNELADRYLALWHEPTDVLRERGIAGLWAPEGVLDWYRGQSRGYAAIGAVLAGKYAHVVNRGFVFERTGDAAGGRGVLKLDWELVPAGGGAPVAVGLDFLELDESGRIRIGYEFCDPPVA
ncbi:MAG TPA: hypothetical protein VH333_24990 [Pseudonocardiaceae bacterium]|nr:hypothetical protein [Pseudonocardiaceae bacterium]